MRKAVTKAQTPASAEPVAPSPSPGDALKPVTGSRNMTWNRHLLELTRGAIKHRSRNADAGPEAGSDNDVSLTMVALQAFSPTDPVEGMIASQAVALYEASLHCFRLAMIPEQPFEVAAKCRKDGANLARAMTDMVDALARHRGKGPQVIRVEKMLVADGGQAVVGNVTAQSPTPTAAPRALEQGAPPMLLVDTVPAGAEGGQG